MWMAIGSCGGDGIDGDCQCKAKVLKCNAKLEWWWKDEHRALAQAQSQSHNARNWKRHSNRRPQLFSHPPPPRAPSSPATNALNRTNVQFRVHCEWPWKDLLLLTEGSSKDQYQWQWGSSTIRFQWKNMCYSINSCFIIGIVEIPINLLFKMCCI